MSAARPLLSVIIPVYNEERTVNALLKRVVSGPYPYPEKEVIVVDDGSRDGTAAILEGWRDSPEVLLLRHPSNRGKGAAVRTGLVHARGEITLIQDADLEYDPADYPRLVEVLRQGQVPVVYGSRYLRPRGRLPWSKFRCAVCLLNLAVRLLYGRRLTDEATCYKALRTDLFRRLDLRAERFELCAEMTAKICRLGLPIVEVPISYSPRQLQEGKKIRWSDAWMTMWTLLRWRVCLFPGTGPALPPPEGLRADPAEALPPPLALPAGGHRAGPPPHRLDACAGSQPG
jgi:glycosyltransferase involved in cell wall biosynthesis